MAPPLPLTPPTLARTATPTSYRVSNHNSLPCLDGVHSLFSRLFPHATLIIPSLHFSLSSSCWSQKVNLHECDDCEGTKLKGGKVGGKCDDNGTRTLTVRRLFVANLSLLPYIISSRASARSKRGKTVVECFPQNAFASGLELCFQH